MRSSSGGCSRKSSTIEARPSSDCLPLLVWMQMGAAFRRRARFTGRCCAGPAAWRATAVTILTPGASLTMSATSLGTLITYNPWTVTADATLEEVAAGFQRLGIHHVGVVDDERRIVGVVSET